ncbi:replicative DNA helicase [Leucobacter massiliensis]|uniref:replicative DNA helicase n=1 Tax=Leucobacter massiliensis TaxID=1686285 RepID=UPI0015E36025|nr:DnaB-like helicase C-terminal domain-containing protein [Leucobacter massiliensis]
MNDFNPATEDPWSNSQQGPTERTAPHDRVAEQSVLGAMMLSARALSEVSDVLSGRDFYEPAHETIFDAARTLAGAGHPVDAITVGDELARTGKLSEVPQGAVYLHELAAVVPSAANAVFYAEIVREKAVHRRMIEFGEKTARAGYQGEGDPSERIEELRAEMEGLLGERTVAVEAIGEGWDAWEATLETPPVYIPTPWHEINDLVGGFEPGGLYVVGARPGGGKSNAGLQIAALLAEHGPVAFSALEMSKDQLRERLAAQRGQIPMSSLKRHDLSTSDKAQLGLARAAVKRLPIFVDDRSGVTVQQVKGFGRGVARKGEIAGVVVDYLQLISSHDSRMAVHEMVGEITRQLKILARELNCPVIVLSQLTRESAQAKGKGGQPSQRPPTLADLSASDKIGHHADVVLMMQRKLEADGEPGDVLEMYVVKNRHGRVGRRQLRWEGRFARVTSQPIGLY